MISLCKIVRRKLNELQKEGFSLDEKNDWYQIRVNERLDVYPKNRRWHDLESGNRGGYEGSFDDFIRWYFHTSERIRKGLGPQVIFTTGAPKEQLLRETKELVKENMIALPREEGRGGEDPIYEEARIFVHGLFRFDGPQSEFLSASTVNKITDFFLCRFAPERKFAKWTCSTCQKKHPGRCPAEMPRASSPQEDPRYRYHRISKLLSKLFGIA